MSGIYIHIPFCKKACYYCDFHFSTSLKKKDEMLNALTKEIELRKNENGGEIIETIYFGGGTPSILTIDDIKWLIDKIYTSFIISPDPEITLEANPDDLSKERIKELASTKINRLSIGIQSFFEDDLRLMNRAHNAPEAENCLKEAVNYFNNISIDLIYGIPNMSNEKWLHNVEKALHYHVPHISSYALTVEPKTALEKFIKKGIVNDIDDEVAQKHFLMLVDKLEKNDFVHYELSNFGKEGFFSKNNTAYWLGKKYLGLGPSAHSYDGKSRSWNIANNSKYINSLKDNLLPSEKEILSNTDRYNEYIMTGLRTMWGVSLKKVETEFGKKYKSYLLQQSEKYIKDQLLEKKNHIITATKKGKFLTDGIASDLFLLNL
ncbi:radical SAM family heme chaperone HemW [Abyssalbus ytuae]|uniref:Heme chaperone HemW n=1 Tax=Abyssalbus ytuae TaxID=2926907 RepID=A0A9E6ZUC9_9FLAO|nr:radical SAM family heme chaperone HemW [Abyssalbus ytuae]UOB19083.1 radical SAM family heme chaperone HemW [Abyssalbus ytuae]